MVRACRRINDIEAFQRHIQIDRHALRQAEGTHTAGAVANVLLTIGAGDHLRLLMKAHLEFVIIHPGISRHDDDERLVIQEEGHRFRDARLLRPECLRRQRHRRR